jgi:hypothetical protein
MMSDKEFCRHCGAQLAADSEFCQKCGKPVKPLDVTTPAATALSRLSGKVGGIDRRLLVAIGVIILILVVPVIPRDKVIYVSGQTATTQTYQSTSFQTIMTTTQTSIQVYVGTLEYVSNQYYGYYQPYYSGCVRGYLGIIRCGYTNWPYWNTYTTSVTVNPGDNVVSMQNTQEVGGYLSTVTLTHYDGTVVSYAHVIDNSLTQTGTSTVQASATQTLTVTQTLSTVMNVPCDKCIPQHVTEYVNIIQYLMQR